ncbi:uncharacterized protein [Dermacentor albipictus]|uniref:uncharacterized protein n=1 Tax=Dermacentor albipictus TaxID=60249 RepID=UPI0038FD0221
MTNSCLNFACFILQISACFDRYYPEDYAFSICRLRGVPVHANMDSTFNGTCDFVSHENLLIDDNELHRCWSNSGWRTTAANLTRSQDDIKPDSRLLLFSGSGSSMANGCLNVACFILQIRLSDTPGGRGAQSASPRICHRLEGHFRSLLASTATMRRTMLFPFVGCVAFRYM